MVQKKYLILHINKLLTTKKQNAYEKTFYFIYNDACVCS